MNARQVIDAFQQLRAGAMQAIGQGLSSPVVRQELYPLLVRQPPRPFTLLVREAFQKEVEFRKALWNRTAEDEGDYHEGIYRCAFLLYRLGDPQDIAVLWSAKHLNMDLGCSMGAEFFVGAGVHESIAFLEQAGLAESADVAAYIRGWFSQPDAMRWQKAWEEDMLSNICSA